MSMTSPTWRALGQVILVYFAVGGAAVTAQDTQPGRATFAEMIAFARLASAPCQRLAPDADSFYALALRRLIQPPIIEEEIAAKKKTLSGFEFVSGLTDGASAMPAKWSRPVFSFRFYKGKISRALMARHIGIGGYHFSVFQKSTWSEFCWPTGNNRAVVALGR
jgi:hypothetical protein